MDTITIVGLATLILLAAVIVRVLPLKYWRIDPSDAWSHIYDAGLIEKEGGIPKKVSGYYPEPQFTYPWLLSWCIARFKPSKPVVWGSWLNIVVSLVEVLVGSSLLVVVLVLEERPGDVIIAAMYTGLLLAFNPAIYSPWMKLYGIHARTVGSLLCSIALISMYLGHSHSATWYIVSLATLSITIFVSKFGIQAALFGSLILVLLTQSIEPVLVCVLSAVLTIAVSRGLAWRILKGHWYHSVFYMRILQYRHRATTRGTLTLYQWILQAFRERNVRQIFMNVVWTPSLRVFCFSPMIILILLYAFNVDQLLGYEKTFIGLALCSLLLIPLITTRGLRFLGEADRYYSYMGTMPLAIASGSVFSSSHYGGLFIAGIIFINSIFFVVFFAMRSKEDIISLGLNEREIGEKIDELLVHDTARVLCFPQNISEKLRPFSQAVFVGLHLNASWKSSDWVVYDKLYPYFFPYTTSDIKYLRSDLEIRYVVVVKRFVEKEYLLRSGLDPDLIIVPEGCCVFENVSYKIVDISR